jgi:hypothetical protein
LAGSPIYVFFGNHLQSAFDLGALFAERIELGEFDVELTLPEFFHRTVNQRLAIRVNQLPAGDPGSSASIDLDTTVGEQRSDGILDAIDPVVEKILGAEAASVLGIGERDEADLD